MATSKSNNNYDITCLFVIENQIEIIRFSRIVSISNDFFFSNGINHVCHFHNAFDVISYVIFHSIFGTKILPLRRKKFINEYKHKPKY